jgi:hypothetical protein
MPAVWFAGRVCDQESRGQASDYRLEDILTRHGVFLSRSTLCDWVRNTSYVLPRAAVLLTILAGAKRHHLEPWAYLRDVLLRLSAGRTDLEPLLPDRWGANHPEFVLLHRLDETRRRATRKKEKRQRRRALAVKKA